MSEPLVIWEVDSNGNLENKASSSLLLPEFKIDAQRVFDMVHERIGSEASLYLRGSIARGGGIARRSDLDLVLVFRRSVPDDTLIRLATELNDGSFSSKFSSIEFDVTTEVALSTGQAPPGLVLNLSTQSFLVWGKDYANIIKKFKPSDDLFAYVYGGLRSEVECIVGHLLLNDKSSLFGYRRDADFWVVWSMRQMLRAAKLATLKTDYKFSNDLYSCFAITAESVPHHATALEQCLANERAPPADRLVAVKLIADSFVQLSPLLVGVSK